MVNSWSLGFSDSSYINLMTGLMTPLVLLGELVYSHNIHLNHQANYSLIYRDKHWTLMLITLLSRSFSIKSSAHCFHFNLSQWLHYHFPTLPTHLLYFSQRCDHPDHLVPHYLCSTIQWNSLPQCYPLQLNIQVSLGSSTWGFLSFPPHWPLVIGVFMGTCVFATSSNLTKEPKGRMWSMWMVFTFPIPFSGFSLYTVESWNLSTMIWGDGCHLLCNLCLPFNPKFFKSTLSPFPKTWQHITFS